LNPHFRRNDEEGVSDATGHEGVTSLSGKKFFFLETNTKDCNLRLSEVRIQAENFSVSVSTTRIHSGHKKLILHHEANY
jgi:hypothetical protein